MTFRVFYEEGNSRCTEYVQAATPNDAIKKICTGRIVKILKVKAAPKP